MTFLIYFSTLIHFTVSAVSSHPLYLPRSHNSTTPSRYFFVFGDSYSTIGFNVSAEPLPSVNNPLGNPPYPGARLSGGKIWLDIVLDHCMRNDTVAYDFATGSNSVNLSVTEPNTARDPAKVQDFGEQMDEFEKVPHIWSAQNSMFINWFGVNDIAVPIAFQGKDLNTTESLIRQSIGDYFEILERQYQLGARKFVTMLAPPMYRSPLFGYGSQDNAIIARNATSFWNSCIQEQNHQFLLQHTLIESEIFDPSTSFNKVLDNPTEYGAPNSTCLNYPEGEPCLWHDFIHPGIAIQRELGKQVGNFICKLI